MRCIIAILLSFAFFYAKSAEIGVEEKLDSHIPLGLHFIDENNNDVILDKLVDKPTILTLVYFNCQFVCSKLLSGVADAAKESDMKLGQDYQIITVSFNFNDTPEKAAEKKKNFTARLHADTAKHWRYLTGDSATIAKLTQSVGFNYKRQGMDFVHPGVIMFLSPTGKITRYLYGEKYSAIDYKMSIIEAKKEQSLPTIQKMYEYCFSYDPEGKRYVMSVTKISATIIIFVLSCLFIYLIVKRRSKKRLTRTE